MLAFLPFAPPSVMLFGVFIVAVLVVVFILGHLTGRWTVARHYAQFSSNPSSADQQAKLGECIIRSAQGIREDEYAGLRKAVERQRETALPEQQVVIDTSLRVMRACRAESAKQRPTVEYIEEGR